MNIRFKMPVSIIMQENCVFREANSFAGYGKNAILIADRTAAAESGALYDVDSALKRSGISYTPYISERDTFSLEYILTIAAEARESGADMVVAVGGGHLIDAGKAVAFIAAQQGVISEADLKEGRLCPNHLPLIVIPTHAGTGAEVSPSSIVTGSSGEEIICDTVPVYASLALIDPGYSLTVPMSVFVSSVFEQLGDIIEIYTSKSETARFMKPIVRDCLLNLYVIFSAIGEDQVDNSVRELKIHTGIQTGIVVTQTGISAFYELAYQVSSILHISHGEAVNLLLIPYLQLIKNKQPDLANSLINTYGVADLNKLEAFFADTHLSPRHIRRLSQLEMETLSDKVASSKRIHNSLIVPSKKEIAHILEQI